MAEAPPSHYRPDIDGLRAIAVCAVLGYHGFPKFVPGGFVGVDLFFVISGFLITGILRRDLAAGTFSFREFYARRIRRIFPALLVVLATTLAAGWLLLFSDDFRRLGRHAGAAAVFLANRAIRREIGYFDLDAELKPLLHLWSLAIEEQFYLLWPLLLVLVTRWRRDPLLLTLAIALVSFVLCSVNVYTGHPGAAFYNLGSRAWELAIGALLAYLPDRPFFPQRVPAPPANVLAFVGASLIVIAIFGYDRTLPFPGPRALLPTLGAAFVIAAGPQALLNRRVLALPLPVFIGLLSYPLYLWHWPLLSFLRLVDRDAGHSPPVVALALALALLLAWLSYHGVERPLRRNPRPRVAISLATAMAAFGIITLPVARDFVPPRLSSPEIERIVRAAGEWSYPPSNEHYAGLPVRRKRAGTGEVVFLGDSLVEQYWPRVAAVLDADPAHALSAVFITRAGCPPIPGIREPQHPRCADFPETAARYLASPAVKRVVIGASWHSYFASTYEIPGLGRLAHGTPAGEAALGNLETLLATLRRNGKDVYLLLNIPMDARLAPHQLLKRDLARGVRIESSALPRAMLSATLEPTTKRLMALADRTGIHVIDPMDYLCDAHACPVVTSSQEPIYKDSVHLRPGFVREQVHFLDRILTADTTP